jgi:hypothetical protein
VAVQGAVRVILSTVVSGASRRAAATLSTVVPVVGVVPVMATAIGVLSPNPVGALGTVPTAAARHAEVVVQETETAPRARMAVTVSAGGRTSRAGRIAAPTVAKAGTAHGVVSAAPLTVATQRGCVVRTAVPIARDTAGVNGALREDLQIAEIPRRHAATTTAVAIARVTARVHGVR